MCRRTVFTIESVHEEGCSTTKASSAMATRSRIPGIGGRSGPSASLPSGLPQPTKHVSANDGHTAKVSSSYDPWHFGVTSTCAYSAAKLFRGDGCSARELCNSRTVPPGSEESTVISNGESRCTRKDCLN